MERKGSGRGGRAAVALALACLLMAASGCGAWGGAGGGAASDGHYEDEAVAFDYPHSWRTLDTFFDAYTPGHNPELGADEVIAVADPATSTPWEKFTTSARVLRRDLPAGMTLEALVEQTYARMPIERDISQEALTAAGVPALERVYEQYRGEPLYRVRDVWLEKDGVVYILSFRAMPDGFDEAQADFDRIVESFVVR